MPNDISLVPPAPYINSNIAAFAGAWKGTWDGALPSALVVEQINTNGSAQVVYSWGDAPEAGIKSGWTRQTVDIAAGKIHWVTPQGATIDFELDQNGGLFGKYVFQTMPAYVEMKRIPSRDPTVIVASAQKTEAPWEEIRIPEHSQVRPTAGKTLMLQTTVYPVDSPGKHPVVIFNHGSTGPGMISANMVFRGQSEEVLFHSLGYIEVIPMRKGRGDSGGANVEEDENLPTSAGLDSAVEDLHTVIDYLSKRPDVDTNRIVLAGVSRGGFLSTIYAGRYPAGIIGVINFSGGWFGEGMPISDFNFQEFRKAGHDARVSILWLYGDHDSFYSLKFVEREFSEFRAAGGTGDLVEVRDISGNGHMLVMWLDKWRKAATDYLDKISSNNAK